MPWGDKRRRVMRRGERMVCLAWRRPGWSRTGHQVTEPNWRQPPVWLSASGWLATASPHRSFPNLSLLRLLPCRLRHFPLPLSDRSVRRTSWALLAVTLDHRLRHKKASARHAALLLPVAPPCSPPAKEIRRRRAKGRGPRCCEDNSKRIGTKSRPLIDPEASLLPLPPWQERLRSQSNS